MTNIQTHYLKSTSRIPNSHHPVIQYQGYFTGDDVAGKAFDTFEMNGWQTQWIFRYGPTQDSHYHSKTHECMTVLSGTATIRFGVADVNGTDHEDGGVEIEASSGDVFVIPAGVAHKTFNTKPTATFALLTPGDGKGLEVNTRQTVANVKLTGFTMLGAYPSGYDWDFVTGDAEQGDDWRNIWSIEKPQADPLLGESQEGLCGLWHDSA